MFVSVIFHLIVSGCSWPWATETSESETVPHSLRLWNWYRERAHQRNNKFQGLGGSIFQPQCEQMVEQSDLDCKIIKQVFRNKFKSRGLGGSSCFLFVCLFEFSEIYYVHFLPLITHTHTHTHWTSTFTMCFYLMSFVFFNWFLWLAKW